MRVRTRRAALDGAGTHFRRVCTARSNRQPLDNVDKAVDNIDKAVAAASRRTPARMEFLGLTGPNLTLRVEVDRKACGSALSRPLPGVASPGAGKARGWGSLEGVFVFGLAGLLFPECRPLFAHG